MKKFTKYFTITVLSLATIFGSVSTTCVDTFAAKTSTKKMADDYYCTLFCKSSDTFKKLNKTNTYEFVISTDEYFCSYYYPVEAKWSIDDPTIAKLSKTKGKKVKVTSLKEGETVLRATYTFEDGSKLKYEGPIKVIDPALQEIRDKTVHYVTTKDKMYEFMNYFYEKYKDNNWTYDLKLANSGKSIEELAKGGDCSDWVDLYLQELGLYFGAENQEAFDTRYLGALGEAEIVHPGEKIKARVGDVYVRPYGGGHVEFVWGLDDDLHISNQGRLMDWGDSIDGTDGTLYFSNGFDFDFTVYHLVPADDCSYEYVKFVATK